MAGGFIAPARRALLPLENPSYDDMTSQGKALFDAMILGAIHPEQPPYPPREFRVLGAASSAVVSALRGIHAEGTQSHRGRDVGSDTIWASAWPTPRRLHAQRSPRVAG